MNELVSMFVPNRLFKVSLVDQLLNNFNITEYGKNTLGFNSLSSSDELNLASAIANDGETYEYAELRFKYKFRVLKHLKYVFDNPLLFASQLLTNSDDTVTTKHSGLSITWPILYSKGLFEVSKEKASNYAASLIPNSTVSYDGSYYNISFSTDYATKLSGIWQTSSAEELYIKALWAHRLQKLRQVARGSGNLSLSGDLTSGVTGMCVSTYSQMISVSDFSQLVKAANALSATPSREELREQRANLLEAIANTNRTMLSKLGAMDNFDTYWSSLKNSKEVDQAKTQVQFDAISIAPVGTASSRTWGIEVETVRAQHVFNPPYWDEKSDGSLEPNEDCSCGCDYCYDGEHYNCGEDECSDSSNAAEYVSPILRSFNSRGLRAICESVPIVYETNTTPGIHVHVGADDLTVVDIARLLQAYSAVSPFLAQVYYRHSRGYCKDTTIEQLRYWLQYIRQYRKRYGSLPSVRDAVSNSPGDRYHDVNVESILKHGTVEFRAMGAVYDYDHLVRWAWLVREMVNVSRLNLPLSTWTSCKSMEDVIAVLQKYGSETSTQVVEEQASELAGV